MGRIHGRATSADAGPCALSTPLRGSGSLTRAAESLNVTHGAISHQIKALEADLGVRLFERAGRGIRLTDEGERFASRVRAAFAELAAAVHEITARANPRLLRVSVVPSFAARWLLPRMAAFSPHARTSISTCGPAGERRFPARRRRRGDPLRPRRLAGVAAEHLLDDRFFPVCSPRLAAAACRKRPEDLARFTLLRSDDEPWKPWFDAAGLDWPEPRAGRSSTTRRT